MKIAILGTLICVAFSEVSQKDAPVRVLHGRFFDAESGKHFYQTVSIESSKRYVRTEHEKNILMDLLNRYYPYSEDKNKEEIKSQRRTIWETYLTSSSKRRKLVPHLVRKLETSAQAH